jgi:hypothetical protein
MVRCDICSYDYVGPFDYLNSSYYTCVSGYWQNNFKYKFGNSDCFIFFCSICNVVLCNACREVAYDHAAIDLRNQLIIIQKNFSLNMERVLLLYSGLKMHKDKNFKKLTKKNIFIMIRNYLSKYPNKELSEFLEL